MSLVVVGLNHKTAPVGLLERLAIPEDRLVKALHQLQTYEHVLEGVILSTCNRVEVYARVSRFHGGAQDLRNFFAEFCHVAPEEIADHLYTYHDDGAARHLFRVSAGLDSLVIGESEILGQVRRAVAIARAEGTVHRALDGVFLRALRVGKRARIETGIGRNPASVSSAAVELARRTFSGSLSGLTVAIVGAGKMGRLATRALAGSGADNVMVLNRSPERAAELAASFNAGVRPFEELPDALAEADIVICSTTSPGTIVDVALVRTALKRRRSVPLFMVDIAVPRDVEPAVRDIPEVILRDIDDLGDVVESSLGGRLQEVSGVERIIAEELEGLRIHERAEEIGPTISAILGAAEGIRTAELDRMKGKLREMPPDQREAIEHLTRRIISRLLHTPLRRAGKLSGKQAHLYLAALRELLEPDDD